MGKVFLVGAGPGDPDLLTIKGLKAIKKADVIQYALTEAQLDPTKEAIIMVGDRNHDILGAQQNGLDSIGVLYGFGEETELQEAGATFLVQSPKDLGAILLQNS